MVLDGRTIDPNKNRCDPTGSFYPWRKFPVYTIRAVHAKKIKTSFHDISISKQADDLKEMKVVLIADLHLGYSVGSKDMEKMVDRINK